MVFSNLIMLDPLILWSLPAFSFAALLRTLPSSSTMCVEVTFSFTVKTASLTNR